MSVYYSVFLSNFDKVYPRLKKNTKNEKKVFTSFHIEEEMSRVSRDELFSMCHKLKEIGYEIIADASVKDYEYFGDDFFGKVGENRVVDYLRLDYGFSKEEQLDLAKYAGLCINASTYSHEALEFYANNGLKLKAIHNYYPRTETALDIDFFNEKNETLLKYNIKPIAFIAGDLDKRGPVFDGLPSVEDYRYLKPYVAYVLLRIIHGINDIFVGDGIISEKQESLINSYDEDEVITLPIEVYAEDFGFFDKVFTIRDDSPAKLLRLAETRVFSRKGKDVLPFNNDKKRLKGSITIDNIDYGRYTGEVMIMGDDKPIDKRVNVIAKIKDDYIRLLDVIKRESKIRFIKA